MKQHVYLGMVILFFLIGIDDLASQNKINLYDPEANALMQLEHALNNAKQENKHVLVQVGGNWCSWCYKLQGFINSHHELDSIIQADYVPVKINYSRENKNTEALTNLQYPQRFGFPVIIVLNPKGHRLHTQDTGLLESGEGYNYKKVKRFLLSWNKKAVSGQF